MNFSSSAKATISSNLRSISLFAHPENRAAQKRILPPRQLRMKSRAYFEQRADAPVESPPSRL